MKKLVLLLHFTFGVFHFSFSQTAPGIEWQNTIGGGLQDELNCVHQTKDGGYILAGNSNSSISSDKTENSIGSHDYWIVKTDMIGNLQWQNTIGGSNWDALTSIDQTTDGGYILGGWSKSNISGDKGQNNWDTSLTSADYWIVKTDSLGIVQWEKTIGGSKSELLQSIKQTSDGGYILGGISYSDLSGDKTQNSKGWCDYWVVKTDSVGNILWQNTIGGSSPDNLTSLQQTTDGGYILGGYSDSNASGDKTENSNGGQDFWVVKIDGSGNIQWQNTIGGSAYDYLFNIEQTNDKGYILGGYTESDISGDITENICRVSLLCSDYLLIKIDSLGNLQWQNTIGGSDYDYLFSVHQTIDNGYVLGGWSFSNISCDKSENCYTWSDYWIVKTDSFGIIQWENTIGGTGRDFFQYVQQTNDGGYILGGYSESNISADKTENCLGWADYWIIKLFPDTTTGISNIQSSTNNIQLYPNPTQDQITINLSSSLSQSEATLTVFDMLGKQVLKQSISNQKSHILNLKSFPSGVYLVQVSNGTQTAMSRFVKM